MHRKLRSSLVQKFCRCTDMGCMEIRMMDDLIQGEWSLLCAIQGAPSCAKVGEQDNKSPGSPKLGETEALLRFTSAWASKRQRTASRCPACRRSSDFMDSRPVRPVGYGHVYHVSIRRSLILYGLNILNFEDMLSNCELMNYRREWKCVFCSQS